MTALEAAVTGQDYVAGARFTAADVYFGSLVLEARPAFASYWERISARPAAKRAQEIDDALMEAQKDASSD